MAPDDPAPDDPFLDVENILSLLFSDLDIETDSTVTCWGPLITKDERRVTPLHLAAEMESNSLGETKNLVTNGADIEAKDAANCTPVYYSARSQNWDTCEFLLLQGANVENDVSREDVVQEVLAEVITNNFLRHEGYKEIQFEVNWPIFSVCDDEYGVSKRNTILHLAVRCGHIGCIEMLLQKGANVDVSNSKNFAPLHLAVIDNSGNNLLNLLIINNANLNSRSFKGKTPLHIAIEQNSEETVRFLLERGVNVNEEDDKGMTPLHYSIQFKTDAITRLLFTSNVNVNSRNNNQETPLHYAASRNPEMINFLVENGADINAIDDKGYTALHFSIKKNDIERVTHLLNNSADPSIRDIKGKSAIIHAINHASIDIVNLLIEASACISDEENILLLRSAVKDNNIDIVRLSKVRLTNEQLEEIVLLALRNSSDDIVQSLLERDGIDLSKIDIIEVAALWGRDKFISIMKEKGAVDDKDDDHKVDDHKDDDDKDDDDKDDDGGTLLHKSARGKRRRALPNLIKLMSLLKDNTIVQDKKGNTPLHVACKRGRKSVVKYLAQNGNQQCLSMKNKENLRPLDIAIKYKRNHVVKYL